MKTVSLSTGGLPAFSSLGIDIGDAPFNISNTDE